MPRSPRGHVAAEEMSQLSERRDAELDHVQGALDRHFLKIAGQAVSGIVHQDIDRHRPLIEAAFQAPGRLKSSLDERSVTIDILVNNAGYGLPGDFQEMPIERTLDMIQLSVTALTELTHLFGRDMAARRSGHILLVASLLA